MSEVRENWIDKAIGAIAPRWGLQRMRARAATDILKRHYEGAAGGRRQQGWRRSGGDPNAIIGPALSLLRLNTADLIRNNPYAERASGKIAHHTCGWGIVASSPKNKKAEGEFRRWAESTACDADGRDDFYGLQKLVMRTTAESGECLVRRRLRRPEDGLRIPIQIQVLDPAFLDTSKDTLGRSVGGARIIQGIEFDPIGRRAAYWLFPEHPGSAFATHSSVRVPAASVQHVFKRNVAGQVRGPSWFSTVLQRLKDFDEYEDATLVKQKIAACLAVLTSDVDGTAPPLGTVSSTDPTTDTLSPGAVLNVPPGRTIEVVRPPQNNDYDPYARSQLRAIAAGLSIPYEALTGDYTDMPFSAARASQISHRDDIHDWRWRMLIPQFCDPVWAWVMEAAIVMNLVAMQGDEMPQAQWTPPPFQFLDPVNEGLAEQRNIRTGIKTWSESVRERGYDPAQLLAEYKSDLQKFDAAGLIFDCDPRLTTQAGQLQGKALPHPQPAAPPAATNEEEGGDA